jgi:murein DD-endopeptidase MepM/ murein hydrolase activator NlpD
LSHSASAVRTDLLLSQLSPTPAFDRLAKLDRTVFLTYTVGAHDDLWSICKRFHTDAFTVRSSNDIDLDGISSGMTLRIPNHRGTLYEVKDPASLQTISRGFNRGKILKEAYDREILLANDFPPPNLRLPDHPFDKGTWIFLPQAWRPSGIPLPVIGRITSGFGRRMHPILGVVKEHHGMDIAKPYGSPVIVSREGVVISAGWAGGYGNMIEVRHEIKTHKGLRILVTRYGHLSTIYVHEGQHVHLNQLIGRVGSTGLSTGPHLHFEIRDETGNPNNPQKYQ